MADPSEHSDAPEQALAGKNLVFAAGAGRFALPADWAAEVVPAVGFTPLPGAPPYLPGVILLRGEVMPLVDLRRFIPESEEDSSTPILPRAVVTRLPTGALAFGADRILGLEPLEGARAPRALESPGVHLLAPVEGEGPTLVEPLGLFRFLSASNALKTSAPR